MYRSAEGFQTSRWGMTPAEVLALYPSAERLEGDVLRVETVIAQTPAVVVFRFMDGRLAAADVRLAAPAKVRPQHQQLRDALATKYGKPKESRDTTAEEWERVGTYIQDAKAWDAVDAMNEAFTGKRPDPSKAIRRDMAAERQEDRAERDAERAERDFVLTDTFATQESVITHRSEQKPDASSITVAYRCARYLDRFAAVEARQKAREAASTAKDL